VIALVRCDDAVYRIAVGGTADEDALEDPEPLAAAPVRPRPVDAVPEWASATLVDVDAAGSTVVLLLDRRPPLMVSHDGGLTWSERGGGLPRGRAVALGDTPDDVVYAARNRLYVSRDGARFWRAVAVELPEIRDVAWEPEDAHTHPG
jgi:hypothetical protein